MRKTTHSSIALILIAVALYITNCGGDDPVLEKDTAKLAPTLDKKIYVTPSTMQYHLAGCPHLTEDKAVMWMSEAIAQGYEPCLHCFPPPKEELPPMVYVIDGDNHYHLALCPLLDETKQAITLEDAVAQGYEPCQRCNYNAPRVESHVYLIPGDDVYYHIVGCPHLTDDKILTPKAEAIEKGYAPCPDCAVAKRIPGTIVYICPESGYAYHGAGCFHLNECNTVQTIPLVEAWKQGYTPCKDCLEAGRLKSASNR